MMQLVRVEEDFSRAGFRRQFVKGQDFIRFVIRIFPSTCGSENSDVPMQRAAWHARAFSYVSFARLFLLFLLDPKNGGTSG